MSTTKAGVGWTHAFNQRTRVSCSMSASRDLSRTPTQKLADHWLAYEENWKKRLAAMEREKQEEWRQRREDERKKQEAARKQQELQRRRAAFELAEQLTDQIFDEAGLSPAERTVVNNRLINADAIHDLERTKVFALQVITERRN